jgi:hypothetical protein
MLMLILAVVPIVSGAAGGSFFLGGIALSIAGLKCFARARQVP